MFNMNNSEQSATSSTNTSFSISSRGIVLVAAESCIFLALDLTALVGNTLVCVAMYRNISLRTITNNFILSLALNDLLMAVLVMPLIVSASLADEWIGGSFGIDIYNYVGFILGGTSVLTVILLAINRYFRVVRPTLYHNIYSMKSSTVMAATAWVVSTVTVCVVWSVLGIELRLYPANPTVFLLVFPSLSALTVFRVLYSSSVVVSVLVITSCYVKIYQTIRHHNTAAAPSSHEGHSSYGVGETKITRILTVVLIGFYLCYLPHIASGILFTFALIVENSCKYTNLCFTFPVFASSVINPLIYAAMSRPFRREFLRIIRYRMWFIKWENFLFLRQNEEVEHWRLTYGRKK